MYNGDQDNNFIAKGIHPTIATITVNNVVYRAHYKGIVTAYNKNTNKSYIVYVPKIKRNFTTALSYSNNKIFLGTQNDGLIIFDKNTNTLKVFKNRKLRNKDIWKIIKKGNSYLIFTDSSRAIKIKARKLEN
jgi:ligand-binding sensor domain-containing protein